MSIRFGQPHPPSLSDPQLFIAGFVLGTIIVFGITYLVDQLGTAMFHRGFAKPFYIKGRRIHHTIIYFVIPLAYCVLSILFFLGYIQLIGNSMFLRLFAIIIVTAGCIAVDFIVDRFWPQIRMDVILHHEWIYSLIPLYIFTYVVNIVV